MSHVFVFVFDICDGVYDLMKICCISPVDTSVFVFLFIFAWMYNKHCNCICITCPRSSWRLQSGWNSCEYPACNVRNRDISNIFMHHNGIIVWYHWCKLLWNWTVHNRLGCLISFPLAQYIYFDHVCLYSEEKKWIYQMCIFANIQIRSYMLW